MGFTILNDPKRCFGFCTELNTSVLNKRPRDCTASATLTGSDRRCTVHVGGRGSHTNLIMAGLQLIPYAARALAAPAAIAAETSAAQGLITELRALVKAHAISSTASNVVNAVRGVYGAISPYVTSERAAAVRSAVQNAVRSYWTNDHHATPSVAQQRSHVKALVKVLANVDPVSFTVARNRPAPHSMSNVVDFHALSRAMRSRPRNHLVGVEPNPGPGRGRNGRGGSGMLRSGVAAAYGTRVVTVNPNIRMARDGKSTRIRHRELLDASVPGSTAFTIQNTFALNPGLEDTFPWLAPQALQWEQYIAHSLRLIWIPIAPTSAQGTISISPSYDPTDPPPTTEQQLSNAVDTVEVSIWKETTVPLNQRAMMTPGPRKFIRGALVASDIKTYDVGVVHIASNNCTDTSPIGKLWIEYDFEFFVPQNSPSIGVSPSRLSVTSSSSGQSLTTATQAVLDFPAFSAGDNPLGIGFDNSTNVFTMPRGYFRIMVTMDCLSTAASAAVHAQMNWIIDGVSQFDYTFADYQANSGGNSVCRLVRFYIGNFEGGTTIAPAVTMVGTGTLSVGRKLITFEIV